MLRQTNDLYSVNRVCNNIKPGLLVIFILLSSVGMAMASNYIENSDTIKPQLFTVSNIVEPAGNRAYYIVTFYQSARFYKMMRKNKNCVIALSLLKQSKKSNEPVQVYLTEIYGDTIERVIKII